MMASKILDRFISAVHRRWIILAAVSLTYVAYLLGLTWPFVVSLMIALVLFMPTPTVMRSWFSRFMLSVIVLMSTAQLLGSIQFLVLPQTGFKMLATLLFVSVVGVVLMGGHFRPRQYISRTDIAGLLVVAIFAVPFTPIIVGADTFNRIARIGGIQAIDGTNHYASIAEIGSAERYTYKKDYYYPKGFYLGHSFIQSAFVGNPGQLSWQVNAVLYLGQYLWYGAILGIAIWYLVVSVMRAITPRFNGVHEYLVALCLGIPLAALYLLSFVVEGFLNYYYVLAVIVIGLLYLLESGGEIDARTRRLGTASVGSLCMYLLLTFGASASWPLLTPPLLLIALLQLLPSNLDIRVTVRILTRGLGVWVLLLGLAHLVPLYFQLKFSSDSASEGLNLTGTLRAFHPYILLLGVALTTYIVTLKEVAPAFRRTVAHVMASLYSFVGALVIYQLFTTGEVRYYAIKTALLLEVLTLALLIAIVGVYIARYRLAPKTSLLFVPLCFIIPVLLIINTPNPLKDVRDLFRDYSGTAKPDYFDHDTALYARLGRDDLVSDFNTTVLHYNQDSGKYYAHMQVPFWANMMQYSASENAFQSLHCVGALYTNFAFGQYTDEEQAAAINKIKDCAAAKEAVGQRFYIITDEASAPYIRQVFGDLVHLVYR